MDELCEHPFRYPTKSRETGCCGGCASRCPCTKRRIGHILVCWERPSRHRDGLPKFLCVVPVCWPMLLVTESLVCGISLLVYAATLPQLGWFYWIFGLSSLGLVAGSLAKAGLTDPGIVPRHRRPHDQSWVWCERSQSYRARDVVFCLDSGVLVRGMDHFCPWTGTTIAGGNIIYFYTFLFGLFAQIFVIGFLLFASVSTTSVNFATVRGSGTLMRVNATAGHM